MPNNYQATATGVANALKKIVKIIPPTPIVPTTIGGESLWCKAESLQPMGAFKVRGAWHRLTDIAESDRAAGVVAFSSGNHAQGIAWSARRLGMPALIVMPSDAPAKKLEATAALGAEIVLYERMTEKRDEIAAAIAAERGAVLVPSYDDPWVVEGQGTTGLEALAQMRVQAGGAPTRIVVPCGGGGLSAGIALAVPDAEIVVVEPDGWDDMAQSLAAGSIQPVGPNPPPTACDALQTLRVAPITFDILHRHGARGLSVTEAEVEAAMRHAFAHMRLVLEPGGAVALAAVLAGKVPVDGRTLVILSGGNVDAATFAAVLAR
jgi:threonine dehydratase